MKYFGAHVSIAGGIEQAPERARAIGANALAMFTKNQRQYNAKPISASQAKAFQEALEKADISPTKVLVHDSYLINMGSPNKFTRDSSVKAFIDEAQRLEALGLRLLNFHPGAHLNKIPEDECIDLIAQGVNQAIKQSDHVIFVIENTAGQGSNLGFKFEHLKQIIEKCADKNRVGVCLDTCHAFAAGYDIASSKESFEKVIEQFEAIVGLKYLKGMHLNDSKNEFNSHKDRHENLGEGSLGIECFKWIAQDSRFDDMPLILETPKHDLYAKEIKMLKDFCAG